MTSLELRTPQTGQSGFGGLRDSELITRAPERSRKTLYLLGVILGLVEEHTFFALCRSPRMTLNACITQRPAVIAFVVAIAGMIFPAISTSVISLIICSGVKSLRLMSNLDLGCIPKTIDRILALAATKSSVSSSSLSKESTAVEVPLLSPVWACSNRPLSRRRLSDVRRDLAKGA